MIGCDGIHYAIQNALDHRVAVGIRAQRRIHLGIGVVCAHMLFREQKVMRRHFACDTQPISPRLPNRSHCLRCRSMRHMQVRRLPFLSPCHSRVSHQADIAFNETIFGLGGHASQAEAKGRRPGIHAAAAGHARVFGMLDHGRPVARRVDQHLAHDAVFKDRMAVVGYGDNSRSLERRIVVEHLALDRACRRADGKHAKTHRVPEPASSA